MKKQNWVIWVGLGLLAWYLWKQNKKAITDRMTEMPGGDALMPSSFASSDKMAAQQAQQIVADVVDQTTFLPDTETDRDLYIKDQISCK